MSAPICGARTWTSSGDLVTCDREPNHESRHSGPVGNDRKLWSVPMCAILLGGCEHVWTPDEARAVRDRIQRQLDALDPDAAIAEAERRMVEARRQADDMARLASMYSRGPGDPLRSAHDNAVTRLGAAVSAWRALVESRDAKESR